jgi:hypothetical protein
MRATGGVDAFFGKHEAFYRPAVHDVGFDNFFNVRGGDAAVPDGIGIHHDRGPVFALIETARHIRAHSFLEPAESEFLLEEELKLGLARGIAAAARVSWLALIAADEKMLLELGHDFNLQERKALGSRLWALARGGHVPPKEAKLTS